MSKPGRPNHYETLGLGIGASAKEIKDAYHRLAKDHHPDKGGDKDKFQAIQEAYSAFQNPESRTLYDKNLEGRTSFFDLVEEHKAALRKAAHNPEHLNKVHEFLSKVLCIVVPSDDRRKAITINQKVSSRIILSADKIGLEIKGLSVIEKQNFIEIVKYICADIIVNHARGVENLEYIGPACRNIFNTIGNKDDLVQSKLLGCIQMMERAVSENPNKGVLVKFNEKTKALDIGFEPVDDKVKAPATTPMRPTIFGKQSNFVGPKKKSDERSGRFGGSGSRYV